MNVAAADDDAANVDVGTATNATAPAEDTTPMKGRRSSRELLSVLLYRMYGLVNCRYMIR